MLSLKTQSRFFILYIKEIWRFLQGCSLFNIIYKTEVSEVPNRFRRVAAVLNSVFDVFFGCLVTKFSRLDRQFFESFLGCLSVYFVTWFTK